MTSKFKQDCFQFNPHMNYLKIPSILKQAIASLLTIAECLSADVFSIIPQTTPETNTIHSHWLQTYNDEMREQLKSKFTDREFRLKLTIIMNAVIALLQSMDSLDKICLIYIEAHFIEKFFKDNFLNPKYHSLFVNISFICSLYVWENLRDQSFTENYTNADREYFDSDGISNNHNLSQIIISCQCINEIFRNKAIANELHNQLETYQTNFDMLLNVVFELTNRFLINNIFQSKYNVNRILGECLRQTSDASRSKQLELTFAKVMFLAKFMEHSRLEQIARNDSKGSLTDQSIINYATSNTFNLVGLKVKAVKINTNDINL